MDIDIAFSVEPSSRKYFSWRDGFVTAVERLAGDHNVRWLNLHPASPDVESVWSTLSNADVGDVVLVKSNWNWHVDTAIRRFLPSTKVPVALAISGSGRPPSHGALDYYDVLFFETKWYEKYIMAHPRRIHAFGVNGSIMSDSNRSRVAAIDWLSVGSLRSYKRHERIVNLPGHRVVIGDDPSADPVIRTQLRRSGVDVRPYVDYSELAEVYRATKNVVVACTTDGGGERAILEARSCGCDVFVATDNPKLISVLYHDEIFDHIYYAKQLERGLKMARAGARAPVSRRRHVLSRRRMPMGRRRRVTDLELVGRPSALGP